jgi:NAD(P)-dependent dehydrogenase (short-subunit alcohol dehydrogenase family)
MSGLQNRRVIVTGGSRGLGRGIVEALVAEKARVVAVARDADRLRTVSREIGAEAVALDVTDDDGAGRLLRQVRPDLLVLCAGAMPPLAALQDQTWETFSRNWEVDAKSTFFWLRHVLRLPLPAGAHVVVVSSGAALRGSPVSGGYASAKRAQWFMTDYGSTACCPP